MPILVILIYAMTYPMKKPLAGRFLWQGWQSALRTNDTTVNPASAKRVKLLLAT
jgi:hypothetical protein